MIGRSSRLGTAGFFCPSSEYLNGSPASAKITDINNMRLLLTTEIKSSISSMALMQIVRLDWNVEHTAGGCLFGFVFVFLQEVTRRSGGDLGLSHGLVICLVLGIQTLHITLELGLVSESSEYYYKHGIAVKFSAKLVKIIPIFGRKIRMSFNSL